MRFVDIVIFESDLRANDMKAVLDGSPDWQSDKYRPVETPYAHCSFLYGLYKGTEMHLEIEDFSQDCSRMWFRVTMHYTGEIESSEFERLKKTDEFKRHCSESDDHVKELIGLIHGRISDDQD